MKSLDNKGQSLIAFIMLLPIFLIFITSLWSYGKAQVTKTKYETDIKSTLKYGINHIEEENLENKLYQLLDKNLEGEKQIDIYENKIRIENTYIDRSNILNRETRIKISYIGYKENNKIIIEKEG